MTRTENQKTGSLHRQLLYEQRRLAELNSGIRQCRKCKLYKSLLDFNKRTRHPLNAESYVVFDSRCRACAHVQTAAWKSTRLDWDKKYREKPGIKEQARLRYKERMSQPGYPELKKQRNRRWIDNNRDVYLARCIVAVHKRRVRKTKAGGTHTPEQWQAILDYYGHRCLRCGRHASEVKITMDHIVPIAKRQGDDSIDNLQPLCRSCNSTKGGWEIVDYRRPEGLYIIDMSPTPSYLAHEAPNRVLTSLTAVA